MLGAVRLFAWTATNQIRKHHRQIFSHYELIELEKMTTSRTVQRPTGIRIPPGNNLGSGYATEHR